jgi:hypothetical protein
MAFVTSVAIPTASTSLTVVTSLIAAIPDLFRDPPARLLFGHCSRRRLDSGTSPGRR